METHSARRICCAAKKINAPLTALTAGEHTLIPLDIDVSPFDNSGTKKEDVSRIYKGADGYAPIFAYLGQDGFAIHVKLREGSVHCQLAYNLLRIMGQESIREDMCFLNGEQFQVKCGISYFQKTRDSPIRRKVQRRRIKNVIQNLIYMAARFVRHAGSLALNFGRNSPWFSTARRILLAFS